MSKYNQISSFIWNVCDDVLRGIFKQHEYGDIILPFTVLRRLDCVMEPYKDEVVNLYNKYKNDVKDPSPIIETKIKSTFFNFSQYDLHRLKSDPQNIYRNFQNYLGGFSNNVRDIIENFQLDKPIEKLKKNNRLYEFVGKFTEIDLHPNEISNHDMGTIFEELLRKFSEMSNETSGEHYTPRDVVRLLVSLVFSPAILESLYQDDELMSALPNDVGIALRYKTAESLDALIDDKPEYFLLALSHVLQTSDEQIVSTRSIQKLWSLYRSDDRFNLPQMYQPISLIRIIGTQYSNQMMDDAIDNLLGLIVEESDNDLFVEVATHLANSDNLFPRLGRILQTYNPSYDQALTLMNWITNIKNVSPKNVVDTYFELLDYWGWDESTQQMIESVGRSLIQNPTLVAFPRHLWKLFESCNRLKLESTARVAMTRLLQQFSQDNNQESIVPEIVRIYRQIVWSKPLQVTFNTWWREYTQMCSLGQLQRLDKDLEGHRILEPQRQILQTAVAMRRLLGTRDLVEFAEAVNTAFSILESMTDAFDKGHLTEIDSQTIRNELDSLSGDLPLDARHILAKNLRELAQYITQMADKRSKPSLMKSDEVIERQLLQGESNPQGSIDVMKWIAGYLGGTHSIDEDE